MHAGDIYYRTILDTKGFQKGIDDVNDKVQSGGTKMKSIIGALGISKLISKGIGMITSSIDTAISRIDTMNNFPKVMSNLGISVDDSNKAINRLEKGLQGLPTTLDAGALAVQRFTSKNGDVQKSTDIFLALNNAILAGGASTQIQESALEQLSQSYSKGKMDMMEWRTLQMAMPAQLKQVADTMGLTVDELGEMMRQGEDTDKVMDQFIDTIIDLNENGGKNIKAFKDQAKNATDGIRTNITNMKTAIARGTKNILESVNTMLKKVNINGIGDLVSRVGKKIESALKNIAKFIEKLPLKQMIDLFKKLLPVIEAVVVGFIAYQVALKAITVINIAKNILSTASAFIKLIPSITSAKDAMTLLNTTFKANTIGLVIAGITTLITLFGIIGSKAGELTEAEKKEKEALDGQTDSVNENIKAWNELKDAQQNQINVGMTEISHYESLYDELKNITDENGKVKDGYEERAKFITDQLSEALGIEINMTDGVIDNYNELKKSIDEVIEKKKAQVILDSQEQLYSKAINEQQNATKKLIELEDTLGKKKENQKKIEEELSRTVINEEREKIKVKLESAKKQVSIAEDNYNKQQNLVKEYAYNISQYETNMELAHQEKYDEMSTVNWEYVKDLEKAGEGEKRVLEEQITTTQRTLDELKRMKEESGSTMYDQQIKDQEKQLEGLKTSLKKYEEATQEGLNNVELDWQTGMANQLSVITGKRYEFKKNAEGNIDMYINGIKSKENVTQDEARNLVYKANQELENGKYGANQAGQNTASGFASGMSSLGWQIRNVASSLASQAISSMQQELDIHSPSRKTRRFGIFFDKGFVEGIKDGSNDVLNQVDTFGEDILDRMENAVNMETGKMSFNGTAGSVSQILSANAQFEGTIPLRVDLDGEKIYDNQQKIAARKNLQYGGAK